MKIRPTGVIPPMTTPFRKDGEIDFKQVAAQVDWLIGAYYNDEDGLIYQNVHVVEPGTPNDVDFFLLGKTEVTREEAKSLTPKTARIAVAADKPFTGHMLDLPKGESNAVIQ